MYFVGLDVTDLAKASKDFAFCSSIKLITIMTNPYLLPGLLNAAIT